MPAKKSEAAVIKKDKFHQRLEGVKMLKDLGLLEKARATHNHFDDSGKYILEFDIKGYERPVTLLMQRKNNVRVFSELDLIAKYLTEELGIRGVVEFLL